MNMSKQSGKRGVGSPPQMAAPLVAAPPTAVPHARSGARGSLWAGRILVWIGCLPALALAVVTACGTANVAGASAASVSVQPGDLPKTLLRCAESGDMGSFLSAVKTKDPSTYQDTMKDWELARSKGATAVELTFYYLASTSLGGSL